MKAVRALIVIDVQNDFLPGGTLGVREGDAVVAPINAAMNDYALVVASQDWHPREHGSFAANHRGRAPGETIELDGLSQILWPVHCVQGTVGAAFAPGLDVERFDRIFRKGIDPLVDSYSAVFDNGQRHATGLAEFLRDRGVREVAVCGIATDYCVKFTALDLRAEGFAVTLLADGCRGVERSPGDVARALEAMAAAGVNGP